MLDGDHGRHAVPRVRAGKIAVLFLQNAQLPGITVDHGRKARLKARQMRPALLGENIVAEAQHIFLKGVHKLERGLHFDLLRDAFKIDRIMDRRFRAV